MEPVETFIEDFLEHHGVKGMKWGVRKKKKSRSTSMLDWKPKKGGNIKRPSQARNILLGGTGNSKARFTDPKAFEMRRKAGKKALTGFLMSTASGVGGSIVQRSGNDIVRIGGIVASQVLNLAGGAFVISGMVDGIKAATTENNARDRD